MEADSCVAQRGIWELRPLRGNRIEWATQGQAWGEKETTRTSFIGYTNIPKLDAQLTWGGDCDVAEVGDSPGTSESTDAARSRRIGMGVGLDMLGGTGSGGGRD